MKNKIIVFISIIIILMPSFYISAYEVDEKHESAINGMITEIYDAKNQYEELVGGSTEDEFILQGASGNTWWWPIGSAETEEINGKLFASGDPETVSITSYFGLREDPFGRGTKAHGALDINGHQRYNEINVIAAKDGVVVRPTSSDTRNCPSSHSQSLCGGGYGNYVLIEHSDGMYTLYGHMYENSILVKSGDEVKQGQVIGKIGSSGNSTGPHLHFEVRTSSAYKDRVDPLDYVDPENPRPMAVASNGISLTTSAFTKEEFVKKMEDYCTRTGNTAFCNNFSKNAANIYDTSVKNNVNPELVVATAGQESAWKGCGATNNYWGIGITNGNGCSSGPYYATIYDGIAGYAKTLSRYLPGGSYAPTIEKEYNDRLAAGADPNGVGLPGTFAGMQMVYSYLGKHEYGSSGSGGYYYMDPARAGVTTIYSTHEEFLTKCKNAGGEHASGKPVTAWEQSRYTIFQMEHKTKMMSAIFGI